MYKKFEIVLFNTKYKHTKYTIWKHVKTGEMSLWQDVFSVDKNWYPFEMYIIGEYYDSDINTNSKDSTIVVDDKQKIIISTTDETIFYTPEKPNFGSYMSFSLGITYPKPTIEFLEWYCKKGGVETVEVEFEIHPIEYTSKVAYDGNYEGVCPVCKDYSHWMGSEPMTCNKHYKLKVLDNSFININIPQITTKETWEFDEVEQLLLMREQHIQDNFAPNKTILNINTWIEQNLK